MHFLQFQNTVAEGEEMAAEADIGYESIADQQLIVPLIRIYKSLKSFYNVIYYMWEFYLYMPYLYFYCTDNLQYSV